MFCNNCGMPLAAGDHFCSHCGKQQSVSEIANVAPLLRRAQLFLESGDLAKSDDYCEQVLDLDPENAQAYVIKLMIRTHVTKKEDLANVEESYADWNSYQNACRFANHELRQQLEEYSQCVEDRIRAKNEEIRLQKEKAAEQAQKKLQQQKEWHDASLYNDAVFRVRPNASIDDLTKAISLLEQIPNYKDAAELLISCQQRLKVLKEENASKLLEQKRQEEKNKKIKHVVIITAVIVSLILIIGFGIWCGHSINAENRSKAELIKSQLLGVSFTGSYVDSSVKTIDDVFDGISRHYNVTYSFTQSGKIKISTVEKCSKGALVIVDGNAKWDSVNQYTTIVETYDVKISGQAIMISFDNKSLLLQVNTNNQPLSFEYNDVTYKRTSSIGSIEANKVYTAEDAMSYLCAIYEDSKEPFSTPANYERCGIVRIADIPFSVIWTVNIDEEQVKIVANEDNSVTIDVNETCEVDTPYVLTATITDETGNSVTHSWDMILPGASNVATIIKEAYALAPGETLPYEITLTGKIISIDSIYNSTYKTISVTIEIAGVEDMPIKCYRLKGDGIDKLMVDNIITVTGTLQNQNGTVEFDAGCSLLSNLDT